MKEGGDMLRLAVWKMCSEAWRIEKVPEDWMQGVIFPLYKEGDNRDRGQSVYESIDRETCAVCRAGRLPLLRNISVSTNN